MRILRQRRILRLSTLMIPFVFEPDKLHSVWRPVGADPITNSWRRAYANAVRFRAADRSVRWPSLFGRRSMRGQSARRSQSYSSARRCERRTARYSVKRPSSASSRPLCRAQSGSPTPRYKVLQLERPVLVHDLSKRNQTPPQRSLRLFGELRKSFCSPVRVGSIGTAHRMKWESRMTRARVSRVRTAIRTNDRAGFQEKGLVTTMQRALVASTMCCESCWY